ncbi:MAG: potassium channel protein [Vicinamibacterales bacterium]
MKTQLLPTIVLLLLVVVGGTAGYVAVEGWSVWDALYMTVTTVATVGFREVHPLSRAGEAFTLVLILVGVSTALYAFSALAAVVVEGGWPKYVEHWRYVRMINHLSNHYVVCGYGRIGSIVANEFKRQETPFVIVDRDPGKVAEANERGHLAVEGDASREDTLKRLGIDRARGLVAAVGTDAENVYAVLTARVMKGDLFIIARAEGEESISKLKKAGADRVISPYRIGGVHIAQTALRPAVVDFMEFATSSDNLELSIEEIRVEESSPLAGRPLSEVTQRDKINVVVVGIQHAQGVMEFNPAAGTVLRAGDRLIVLGSSQTLKEMERAAK